MLGGRCALAVLFFSSILVARVPVARADGVAVRFDGVQPGEIKLDGIPREWPSTMTALTKVISGAGPAHNFGMRGAITYDDTNVYVAAEVADEHLSRTPACADREDHASLVVAFPEPSGGYATHEVDLFPGVPGRMAGCVKAKGGMAVTGAKIIEAPKPVPGGYTFEAVVPWTAFPEGARTRVGLRGALRYYDGAGGSSRNVIGTSTDVGPADLPRLPVESEQSLDEGLLKQKSLSGPPKHDRIADVTGDGMYERVLLYDRYLVILGPHFRGGTEYYFNDLAVDVAAFDVRDVNGDGKAEILVRKRVGAAGATREVLQILAFGRDGAPSQIFLHEVGITTPSGQISNEVRYQSDGGHPAIEIRPGTAKGLSAENYREPRETSMDPLLLPWGTVKAQTFRWNGSAFAKAREEEQAGQEGRTSSSGAPRSPRGAAADAVAQPAPSHPPTAEELQDQVYTLFKRERRLANADRPRFDFAVDVAEDARPERVLVHGRDLVVFGKGYKTGVGYAYITLQQFADPKDIADVSFRDLTNDGKAEIVVRGTIHVAAPKEAKTSPKAVATVDRELLLIYSVSSQAITRVFAAETGRSLGEQRVEGLFALTPGARATDIELRPGRAYGWTERTYPFEQDRAAVGGVEPLLLPWSNAPAVRYHWDGSAFAR